MTFFYACKLGLYMGEFNWLYFGIMRSEISPRSKVLGVFV